MLDYALVTSAGAALFAQAMLGLLVTTRPPAEQRRLCYEVAFAVLGFIGVVAVIWGGIRTANTQNQMSAMGLKSLSLSQQSLEVITGDGSFPYVWPMIKSTPDVSLVVGNSGNQPLTGVEVHIMHTASDQRFQSVGTVPPQANRLLPFNIVPEVQSGSGLPDSYDIDITAQNGNYTEIIMFMPADAKIRPRTTPQIEGRKWQALVTLSKQVCKTNTFDGCKFVQLHDKNLDHFKNWAN